MKNALRQTDLVQHIGRTGACLNLVHTAQTQGQSDIVERIKFRQQMMKLIDKTQMAIGKEQLYDLLPSDVKPRVVWRPDFWLPDEALSVYVRSAGLFGNEMHSPIMCIGNGIPAIVCRWAEQTSKGIMWRDIGLSEWLFDLDSEDDKKKVAAAVLTMAKNPAAAKEKAATAREFVQHRQREAINVLRKELLEP